MTDLVNAKYFVSYGEKRVLILNIQDKLSRFSCLTQNAVQFPLLYTVEFTDEKKIS
jgi:hypothetical protein